MRSIERCQVTRTDIVKCFVVGCARSGTTLLSVLLDRHSLLAMTPETGFYQEVAPQLTSSSSILAEDVLSRWRRLPELGLSPRDVIARCDGDCKPSAVLESILALYAESRSKEYCGEKTPIHRSFVAALLTDFPSARVLHIYRDGRDVALSLLDVPWWTRGIEGAADLWLDAVKDITAHEASFPNRFMAVRLEDLVDSPPSALTRTMQFLGLEFEASQLDESIHSGVVLERSMAWKGRALGAIDIGRSGRWRRGFSSEQLSYLQMRMGAQLSRLDYA